MQYNYDRGKHKGFYLVNSGRDSGDPEPDFAQAIHDIINPGPGTIIRVSCADESLVIDVDPNPGNPEMALVNAYIASHKNAEKAKIDLEVP